MTPDVRDRVDFRAGALLILLCVLWGVQQVAVKVAISEGLPPVLLAGLRSLIAAACLCAWEAGRGNWAAVRRPERSPWPAVAIAVLFALEFLFLFPGLGRTSASRGVVILYTAPFFVAAGAHLFLPAERMGWRQAAGLLVAFAGVGGAMLTRDGGPAHGTLFGDLLVLLGAASWGATTVVIKATGLVRAAPGRVLLIQLAGAAPILLLLSLALGESWDVGRASALAWASLAFQSAGVAFASYLAWFWLVSHYPAARISAFTFLTPLFGILAGAMLLGEAVPAALLAALACVGLGLWLVNSRPARREDERTA